MRLTTIVLAGIVATTALAGSAMAQQGTHLSGRAALNGISPFLFDREEDAVRRAFQSVLQRDPTGSELRRYRSLMEDEHWSEADVRRDLGSRTDYQRYSTNKRSMQPEVIIRRAYRDILGRDPDAEGMRTYRSNIIERNWSEQDVREALRNSPEYASGGARTASADRIVRRAYQDILGREPDPSGLETYRRNIVDRGWDEQDVRTALRKSQERREVVRGQRSGVSDAEATDIVRRAYQSVLKREPDPTGMQEYKARILNDRWTEQQVVSALRNSQERHDVVRGQRTLSDAEATDMVRRAYQSVLNREPDAAGLRDYKARVMNDRWTEQQLVNALRNSDEYRSKH
jgi:TorA maturation chaperone TorD